MGAGLSHIWDRVVIPALLCQYMVVNVTLMLKCCPFSYLEREIEKDRERERVREGESVRERERERP